MDTIHVFSQMGKNHARTNNENQDALCHGETSGLCVITLADGVSDCAEAKRGAVAASETITKLFLKEGPFFLKCDKEQVTELVISHILWELEKLAKDSSRSINDFSSTVVSVLVDKKRKRMLCFNLGDGIILASEKGKCKVLSQPADSSIGCLVTTTRKAAELVSLRLCDTEEIDSVVICSDGAWREMYMKNRLKPKVAQLLVNNEYDALKDYLINQNCFDDHSFISLDIRRKKRRYCA